MLVSKVYVSSRGMYTCLIKDIQEVICLAVGPFENQHSVCHLAILFVVCCFSFVQSHKASVCFTQRNLNMQSQSTLYLFALLYARLDIMKMNTFLCQMWVYTSFILVHELLLMNRITLSWFQNGHLIGYITRFTQIYWHKQVIFLIEILNR